MTLKLNEWRKEKIKCELRSNKSCPGREQGNRERVQILPYNFCDDFRGWWGDILWLLSWPRHNQTLRHYLQKSSFSWGSQLSFWMLCPFLLPSLSVPIGKDDEFYTLWCSSVECQPQKFSLKISLLPHLSSLFCLWVTSGVLAEVSRQLRTAPDSPRAAG